MSESRTPLEDTGHNIIIYGRVFKTADVLTDFHESQPYAMIVRITSTTRKVIEPNPNLKVIVRHDADFDVLDVKTYPDNNISSSPRTGSKQYLHCRGSNIAHLRVQP